MEERSHTWREIASQPIVWQATLEPFAATQPALQEFLVGRAFEGMIAIGCGSTHYLSLIHISEPTRPY